MYKYRDVVDTANWFTLAKTLPIRRPTDRQIQTQIETHIQIHRQIHRQIQKIHTSADKNICKNIGMWSSQRIGSLWQSHCPLEDPQKHQLYYLSSINSLHSYFFLYILATLARETRPFDLLMCVRWTSRGHRLLEAQISLGQFRCSQ